MKKIIVVAVLAITCLVGWFGWQASHRPSPEQSPIAQATASPLPNNDARRLQQALGSPDRQAQAASLSPSARTALLAQTKPLLPAHATVTLIPSTFRFSGSVGAVDAELHVSGRASQAYTIVLSHQGPDGPWLILATYQK